jgi:hypothetical protein
MGLDVSANCRQEALQIIMLARPYNLSIETVKEMKTVCPRILLFLLIHPVVFADVSGSFIEALKLQSTKIEDAAVYYEPCLEEKLPSFKTAYSEFTGAEEKRVR